MIQQDIVRRAPEGKCWWLLGFWDETTRFRDIGYVFLGSEDVDTAVLEAAEFTELDPDKAEFVLHRAGSVVRVAFPVEFSDQARKVPVKVQWKGASKIQAVKVVREITALGLKEAKNLCDCSMGDPYDFGLAWPEEIEKLKAVGFEVTEVEE